MRGQRRLARRAAVVGLLATAAMVAIAGRVASGEPPPTPRPVAGWRIPLVEHREAEVAGWRRTWTVVSPRTASRLARPLVVLLHGRGGSGASMRAFGFDALARRDDVVVAYPDGLDGSWNDGREGVDSLPHREHIDETKFFDLIVQDAATRYRVDPTRVAMVGYSNGALMASVVACLSPHRAVAFALVSGPGPAGLPDTCAPDGPQSLLEMHSHGDPIVPFAGGAIASAKGRPRGASISVDEWRAMWQHLDQCGAWTTTDLPGAAPAATMSVAQECQNGARLENIVTDDATHAWHQSPAIDTTVFVWDFILPALRG
jgi:polyhydroxybutyrate depolymerase